MPPGHQTPSATGGWRPVIPYLVDLMVSHLVADTEAQRSLGSLLPELLHRLGPMVGVPFYRVL